MSNKKRKQRIQQLRTDMLAWLSTQTNQMVQKEAFFSKTGNDGDAQSLLSGEDFVTFSSQGKKWVQDTVFYHQELKRSIDMKWDACMLVCGEVVRQGGSKSKTNRLFVVAGTYTEEAAAKRLSFHPSIIKKAVKKKEIFSFVDPEGKIRIPAQEVETALLDEESWEKIGQYSPIRVRHIS